MAFIESQPGLQEACDRYPKVLMCAAPQLIFPCTSGHFSSGFDALLRHSVWWYRELRSGSISQVSERYPVDPKKWPEYAPDAGWDQKSSAAEISDFDAHWRTILAGIDPMPGDECDSLLAVRHPYFDDLARNLMSGAQGFTVEYVLSNRRDFKLFDLMIWLLSERSDWLPSLGRRLLSTGSMEWTGWTWRGRDSLPVGYQTSDVTGTMHQGLTHAQPNTSFQPTPDAIKDLQERIDWTRSFAQLPEPSHDLLEAFLATEAAAMFIQWRESFSKTMGIDIGGNS
jgi:hypothetical protein